MAQTGYTLNGDFTPECTIRLPPTLTDLDISGCAFSPSHEAALFGAIAGVARLTRLCYSYGYDTHTHPETRELQRFLEQTSALRSLSIYGVDCMENPLDSTLLAQLSGLTYLAIEAHGGHAEFVEQCLEPLQKMTWLCELRLVLHDDLRVWDQEGWNIGMFETWDEHVATLHTAFQTVSAKLHLDMQLIQHGMCTLVMALNRVAALPELQSLELSCTAEPLHIPNRLQMPSLTSLHLYLHAMHPCDDRGYSALPAMAGLRELLLSMPFTLYVGIPARHHAVAVPGEPNPAAHRVLYTYETRAAAGVA